MHCPATDLPSSVSTAETELFHLDETILRLQRRRDRLRQFLIQQRLPSPPHATIHNIPAELLLEIFTSCLLPDRYHDDAVDTRRAPWHLAQVSHSWRTLILNSPTLWARIDLCLGHPKESDHSIRRVVSLLQLRLARTQSLPLKLHVKAWRGTLDLHPVFKTLLGCSDRWQVVKFTASYSIMNSMSECKGHFPLLKSFQWTSRGAVVAATTVSAIATTPVTHSFDALKFAPMLRKVVFSNLDVSLGTVKAPWTQLTAMSLHYDTADTKTLLSLLAQTKNLERCELWYRKLIPLDTSTEAGAGDILAGGGVVRLPVLRHLTIVNSPAPLMNTDSTIIPYIHLPALESLSIQSLSNPTPVLDLLHNSSCWLTTFRVSAASLSSTQILELLMEMPCVKVFDIRGCDLLVIEGDLCRALMYNATTGECPWPYLESIYLQHVTIRDTTLFTDMIESRFWIQSHTRSPSPAQLVDVSVTLSKEGSTFTDGDLERWRRMMALTTTRCMLLGSGI